MTRDILVSSVVMAVLIIAVAAVFFYMGYLEGRRRLRIEMTGTPRELDPDEWNPADLESIAERQEVEIRVIEPLVRSDENITTAVKANPDLTTPETLDYWGVAPGVVYTVNNVYWDEDSMGHRMALTHPDGTKLDISDHLWLEEVATSAEPGYPVGDQVATLAGMGESFEVYANYGASYDYLPFDVWVVGHGRIDDEGIRPEFAGRYATFGEAVQRATEHIESKLAIETDDDSVRWFTKADPIEVRLPQTFWFDRRSRGYDGGTVVKTLKKHVVLRMTPTEVQDYLKDALHYIDPANGYNAEFPGLVASARASVAALQKVAS